MIFPEDYIVPFILFLTMAFASFTFVHASRANHTSRENKVILEAVREWVAARVLDEFTAVHGQEWRWVVDPWPAKPWIGTKNEELYEDTYG